MKNKHLLFMLFQLKSVCRDLPRLLICFVALALVILIAGVCGNSILNSKNTPLNIKVGTVIPEDDSRVSFGVTMLQSMESINEVCTFEEMDLDTAKEKLEKGEIAFIAYVPEGFVDSILHGENTPGYVITPENANTETLLFCSVLDAGCHTFSYVQAGIYSVSDFLRDEGFSRSQMKEVEEDANMFYLRYAFNRSKFFNHINVSATGNTSVAGYYLCSGIILLVLLCSLTLGRHFSKHSTEVMCGLKRCGINSAYIKFTELLTVSLVFFGIIGSILLIGRFTFLKTFLHMNALGFMAVFAIIASIVSFIMFFNSFGTNKLASTLAVFLLTAVMMYVCGRFVPSAYLPDAVTSIGKFMPLTQWAEGLESALFAKIPVVCLLLNLGITGVFYGGSLLSEYIRGRALS